MQILQLTVLILFFTLSTAAQAATCGNGGWCPNPDRGDASTTLPGGRR
jgi:hypothetical protein